MQMELLQQTIIYSYMKLLKQTGFILLLLATTVSAQVNNGSFEQTGAAEWSGTESIQENTIIDSSVLRNNLQWLYDRIWLFSSGWTFLEGGQSGEGKNELFTDANVFIDGDVMVTGNVTAADPTEDGHLVTLGFLKSLFSRTFGYQDFGNMRDAQSVPQSGNSCRYPMREFYHPDEATADFLCRHMGFDEGTWTTTAQSGGSGWNYCNLSVVTYDQALGRHASISRSGQRYMCIGSQCASNPTPYMRNLRCLAEVENQLKTQTFTDTVLRSDQIDNFSPVVTTESVATSPWGACTYNRRSDGLNYMTTRTVRCQDTSTGEFVADNQCHGAPARSWRVFATQQACTTFRTTQN